MSKYNNSKKIYTVQLKKSIAGLGFLLRQRDEMPYLGVWEILKNGSADQCGRIRKGDVILKVDKHDLTCVSYEKGLEIIRSLNADSLVELTMMQNEDGEKLNGLRNGLMSPIVKLRKKFMNCASENHFKKDSLPDHTEFYSNKTLSFESQKPLLNNSDTQCNLINCPEPLETKNLNSIRITQDGDDIRIKIYDGLEIVTNRTICMSPESERKISHKENKPDQKEDKINKQIKCNPLEKIKSIDSTTANLVGELSPSKQKKKKGLKLKYLIDESTNIDLLHHKSYTVKNFLIFYFDQIN